MRADIDQPAEYKVVAKRPRAKEGGREEEEKRLGISTGPGPGRLRNKKESEKTPLVPVLRAGAQMEFPALAPLGL